MVLAASEQIEAPELYHIVQDMDMVSSDSNAACYIVEDDSPNAFGDGSGF